MQKKQDTTKKIKSNKIVIKYGVIMLIIALIIIVFSMYIANPSFREVVDKYFFRKEALQDNLPAIQIDAESSTFVLGHDKYIDILSKNKLIAYNSNGKNEFELDINVNNPVYSVNNRFLMIAEKNGQKAYMISGKNIMYQVDIEGSIDNVQINKNGFAVITINDTTYKTVLIILDPDGKELFRTFLSKTYAIDTDISNDNKYLAIAEVDTSGALVQSRIKILSMEKAKTNPEESITRIYTSELEELVINLKYQDKDKLICLFNDKIIELQNDETTELIGKFDKNYLYTSIELSENILNIKKTSSMIFNLASEIEILNVFSKKINIYPIEGIPNKINTNLNIIALNLGTEVHFINTSGWLLKRYISKQEIKDVYLLNNMAGIIYRDKVEIISF